MLACSTHKLLGDAFAAQADGSYHRMMNRLAAVSLLIVDDFGLRPLLPQGTDDLYELIHRRYERGSILLTSNRDASECAELFEDSLPASAVTDRLTHYAQHHADPR